MDNHTAKPTTLHYDVKNSTHPQDATDREALINRIQNAAMSKGLRGNLLDIFDAIFDRNDALEKSLSDALKTCEADALSIARLTRELELLNCELDTISHNYQLALAKIDQLHSERDMIEESLRPKPSSGMQGTSFL